MWQIKELELPLKYVWRISRNASTSKTNFIVEYSGADGYKGAGEVAPNIRYNETPEVIRNEFARFRDACGHKVFALEELEAFLDELKLPSALRFGIESAFVHYKALSTGVDVNTLLDVPRPAERPTSFSFPIMDASALKDFWQEHDLARFRQLKLKVNADNALDMVQAVRQFTQQPLLIDANESWKSPDDVLRFIARVQKLHVLLVEQPMPAGCDDEYLHLKGKSHLPIFADESFLSAPDFEFIRERFDGVNLKLMKSGGYLNAIRLLHRARLHGLQAMVGCMVETSLGIASALRLCFDVQYVDLDGFLIIKEDPFGLVKEEKGYLMLI